MGEPPCPPLEHVPCQAPTLHYRAIPSKAGSVTRGEALRKDDVWGGPRLDISPRSIEGPATLTHEDVHLLQFQGHVNPDPGPERPIFGGVISGPGQGLSAIDTQGQPRANFIESAMGLPRFHGQGSMRPADAYMNRLVEIQANVEERFNLELIKPLTARRDPGRKPGTFGQPMQAGRDLAKLGEPLSKISKDLDVHGRLRQWLSEARGKFKPVYDLRDDFEAATPVREIIAATAFIDYVVCFRQACSI